MDLTDSERGTLEWMRRHFDSISHDDMEMSGRSVRLVSSLLSRKSSWVERAALAIYGLLVSMCTMWWLFWTEMADRLIPRSR